MSTIKAIETSYKGYRFRSRLEARWAVFFDAMEFKWDYEHEGFSLPSGNYLPDFRIFDQSGKQLLFAEVKGPEPTHEERQLCFELADASKINVLLLSGGIGIKSDDYFDFLDFKAEVFSGWRAQGNSYVRGEMHFAIRLPAMLARMGFEDRFTKPAHWLEHDDQPRHEEYVKSVVDVDREYYFGRYKKEHPFWKYGVVGESFFTGKSYPSVSDWQAMPHGSDVAEALNTARSARFEHGETPAPSRRAMTPQEDRDEMQKLIQTVHRKRIEQGIK